MGNAGWDELQAEIKTGRNINNLRYADDSTIIAESKEELKNLLLTMKGEAKIVQHNWAAELNWTESLSLEFPGGSVVNNPLPANAGDTGDSGLIPGSTKDAGVK